jgi:hypothetical protein
MVKTLTKAEIDKLVDALPRGHDDWNDVFVGDIEHTGTWLPHKDLKLSLYLAAGLTETGGPKMEPMKVVRAWATVSNEGNLCITGRDEDGVWGGSCSVYNERPVLNPNVSEIRRIARVEIREVPIEGTNPTPIPMKAQLYFGPYSILPLKGGLPSIHGTWDGWTFTPDAAK